MTEKKTIYYLNPLEQTEKQPHGIVCNNVLICQWKKWNFGLKNCSEPVVDMKKLICVKLKPMIALNLTLTVVKHFNFVEKLLDFEICYGT